MKISLCKNCVSINTRPGLSFDINGTCSACSQFEERKLIDWNAREAQFRKLTEDAKTKSTTYDCIIPVSGGKDSMWQVLKALEYGLKPLALTWKAPSRTSLGYENLANLINLGVDHIDFTVNPKVESLLTYESFKRFGTSAIPMHMAIYSLPLTIALKLRIPLIIYGENSAIEYGDKTKCRDASNLTRQWLQHYGATNNTNAEFWENLGFSSEDLKPYKAPNFTELSASNIKPIFLGYFFSWDPLVSYRTSKQYGFKAMDNNTELGSYNHSDIDENFINIHHYMKILKFGSNRLMDNMSLEIRHGRISRSDAIDKITREGCVSPKNSIASFCDYLKISLNDFNDIKESFRNSLIWSQVNNKWKIIDHPFAFEQEL